MQDKDDEFLWQQAAAGDTAAEEELVHRYHRIVKMCARPYFLAGGDSEDLIQEGMLGLLSAVRRYDPKREASFHTFAEQCIKNRLYTAIKSASRSKHTPLNESVSFESPQFDENQARLIGVLRDPEELVIVRERVNEIIRQVNVSLSKFEYGVLELYLAGLSYSDIAKSINKSPKSIDNAVQRIRKKLAQNL